MENEENKITLRARSKEDKIKDARMFLEHCKELIKEVEEKNKLLMPEFVKSFHPQGRSLHSWKDKDGNTGPTM